MLALFEWKFSKSIVESSFCYIFGLNRILFSNKVPANRTTHYQRITQTPFNTNCSIFGYLIQYDKNTPPSFPKKWAPLKKILGMFQNISNKKKNFFFNENFLDLEYFRLKKWTLPITHEILISQKILLLSKLLDWKDLQKRCRVNFPKNQYLKCWNFRGVKSSFLTFPILT